MGLSLSHIYNRNNVIDVRDNSFFNFVAVAFFLCPCLFALWGYFGKYQLSTFFFLNSPVLPSVGI